MNNILLVEKLDFKQTGTGNAALIGSAGTLNHTNSCTGNLDGRDLAVHTARVICSGTGSVIRR